MRIGKRLRDLLDRTSGILGVTVDEVIHPKQRRRTRATDDGHVKVLMSCRYNNFEARRPLPPDATDEEYDAEFEKAIRTVERAIGKFEKITDLQEQFNDLRAEYEYLLQIESNFQDRDHIETPLSSAQEKLLGRASEMQQILDGHKDPYDWANLLNDDIEEDPDGLEDEDSADDNDINYF